MKREILAFTLAFLLSASFAATPVFAADGDDGDTSEAPTYQRKTRIQISQTAMTLRVGQTRLLWAYIEPASSENKDVTWESSDPNVAEVTEEGVVIGVSPGTAEITASAYNRRWDSCVVTVSDSPVVATPSSRTGGDLAEATLRSDAQQVLRTTMKDQTAILTYKDHSFVSTRSLRSAIPTEPYRGRQISIRFSTTDENGNIQGQLSIDPRKVGKEDTDIRLGVYTTSSKTQSAHRLAQQTFAEGFAVVCMDQSGGFGMPVRVAAPVSLSGLDTSALKLYSYNTTTHAYEHLKDTNYHVDEHGVLYFTTQQGGTVIITDRARK